MSISELAYKIFPRKAFIRLQKAYHKLNKKLHKPLSKGELKKILDSLGINQGDVVFIHSSVDKLNLDFSVKELFLLLKEQVGNEGTLLFPSWAYNSPTKEYIDKGNVFNVKRSFTLMGLLPEFARRSKKAIRSLHPTASVAAIGKYAKELTYTHHLSEYACDENSPLYKMMKYNAKIVGLGEKTVSMSFMHCIEDTMKDQFPVSIYSPEKFTACYIDYEKEIRQMEMFIRKPNLERVNVPAFFSKHTSEKACRQVRVKGRNFFVADANLLFKEITLLAKKGVTVYK